MLGDPARFEAGGDRQPNQGAQVDVHGDVLFAQADQYAPYYFTLAVEYLRKAREEAAHADFQSANRLGRQASRAARRAVELSIIEVRNRGGAP